MSNTLSGLTPAQTFQGLIKVGNNTNVDGTAKVLSDGSGNDLPMEVSTTGVNFTGTLTQNGQPVTTPPSGVSGSIQFSDGSAFASDSNLFWDNTNKRLGVGTNSPTEKITAITSSAADGISLRDASNNLALIGKWFDSSGFFDLSQNGTPYARIQASQSYLNTPFTIGSSTALSARVGIKGSGSTSATTSLLVQNSLGTEIMKLNDSGRLFIDANNYISSGGEWRCDINFLVNGTLQNSNSGYVQISKAYAQNGLVAGTTTLNASAILQADSTTKGFLPPRMTTTQKNAISSPASGLMVYDTDTNKLCCYNGTSWNDLF